MADSPTTADSPAPAPAPDPIPIPIAPDGDTILIVGTEKARLRVSSATLSGASPVFHALFSATFHEGLQPRSDTSPVAITLPEDDPAAMRFVCDLVHLVPTPRGGTGTGTGTGAPHEHDEILAVAVVVDKYGLADALHWPAAGLLLLWLHHRLPGCDVYGLGDLVAAALLLDQPLPFRLFTRHMILICMGSFARLSSRRCGQYLSAEVFAALEAARTSSHGKLVRGLLNFGDCPYCVHRSELTHNFHGDYLNKLVQAYGPGIFEPRLENTSLAALIQASKSFKFGATIKCPEDNKGFNVKSSNLKFLTAEIEKSVVGLCLQCVQNRTVHQDEPCVHL